MNVPWRCPPRGAAIGLCFALLFSGSVSVGAQSDEYVVFTWGGRLRVLGHQVDLENARVNLVFGEDDTVSVPLRTVSKVLDVNSQVVLDLAFDELQVDVWDPPDAQCWKPIAGWSKQEFWDAWDDNPQWSFRWTASDSAYALVPPPARESNAIELRVLPISYALRVLGEVTVPDIQSLRVSLDGRLVGDLMLIDQGWQVYRLPLSSPRSEGPGLLRLEVSYQARPADFSHGRSADPRMLGVALDYVHFVNQE